MALKALPHGTVTLLFTDIEGSTQHWEDKPDEMNAALRRHDALLRAAIEERDGHVFKTMGDQFCAAFAQASDAAAAAANAQRALAREDWNAIGGLLVRIALHSGVAEERDGDYFGPAVNRVARLLATVHGGQIAVSGATAHLLDGAKRGRTQLRDLGEHRLKDLIEPEHVWQLVAPGLRDTFPPLQSLGSLPNNLPRQVTVLIGREDVLTEIKGLVLEQPLVTLVGTGGVGKTRLALQAGADLLDGSPDGVWFVELAPVSEPSLLVNTIASTLGLREQANRSILDVLIKYLRPRRLLLILDNCEHLIGEAARVADEILRAAPGVRILATSREPLRIDGEQVYRVPSLAVPSDDSLKAEEALQYGAVALFAQRAMAADPRFALTDASAPIVADICRRLDGIAFAIELAAARVNVLPPGQLARRLDERFHLLTGGSRAALPRQQTMRALIDWSHDLLTEPEQRLFHRLAIFVGGWTLEAAEAVCSDERLDALNTVDLVSSLVDKSLVVAEPTENARYRLQESIRAFALEKLERSGEREMLARRHAQWAGDLGDRAYAAAWTVPTSQHRVQFQLEVENARSAIELALSQGDVILGARILSGFHSAFRGFFGETEIRTLLETVLARLDAAAQPALGARVWQALSLTVFGSRRIEAAQHAVELGERSNDVRITTLSLSNLALDLRQVGRTREAHAASERALRLSREHAQSRSAIHAVVLNTAAAFAKDRGHVHKARELLMEMLALGAALGDESVATTSRLNMAELEFEVGSPARALELVSAIDAEMRERHTTVKLAWSTALVNGAAYHIALGDIGAARRAACDGLRIAHGVYELYTTIAIQHLAAVAALSGDPRRAARLRGYVDAWFQGNGYEREPTGQRGYETLMTALRKKLSDEVVETLAAEGARLSEDQAVAEAMAVTGPAPPNKEP